MSIENVCGRDRVAPQASGQSERDSGGQGFAVQREEDGLRGNDLFAHSARVFQIDTGRSPTRLGRNKTLLKR